MMPIEIWLLGWFVVGLVTFQLRGVKGYLEDINGLNSKLGFISLLSGFFYSANTLTLSLFIKYIVISVIVGFLFSRAYLIGANFSRWIQFGEMSPNIIIHVLLLFIALKVTGLF